MQLVRRLHPGASGVMAAFMSHVSYIMSRWMNKKRDFSAHKEINSLSFPIMSCCEIVIVSRFIGVAHAGKSCVTSNMAELGRLSAAFYVANLPHNASIQQ